MIASFILMEQKNSSFDTNIAAASANDFLHSSTSTFFRETLLSELQHIKALFQHKQNQLNVYNSSKELVAMQRDGADGCLVFLADNLFVMRKNELAKAILQRQIQFFTGELQKLDEERKALELKLCVLESNSFSARPFDNDELVNIHEKVPENAETKGVVEKRIAHLPSPKRRVADKTKAETDQINETNPPKDVSEKDYADFLKLLEGLDVSEEESWKEDMENGGGKTAKRSANDIKKRVQFAKGTVTLSAAGKKSILRNRNERSPVNAEKLQKMCRRDFVEFRTISKETLSDFVFERSFGTNREAKRAAERRKTKNGRAMSAWKTRKMGMPDSDEDAI